MMKKYISFFLRLNLLFVCLSNLCPPNFLLRFVSFSWIQGNTDLETWFDKKFKEYGFNVDWKKAWTVGEIVVEGY